LQNYSCFLQVENHSVGEGGDNTARRVRRSSFVGTAQYVSPEVLEGDPVSPATDLWAFGVVVYQFLTGKHAFHDASEYLMYKRIQKLLYSYPSDFPKDAKDLVDRLLIIKSFEEPKAGPSKLWMAWLYRDLSGEPKWTKARVSKLFGPDPKVIVLLSCQI
ncbi:hypothetical protein COOONC_14164, partial [Cooperia oncophora]